MNCVNKNSKEFKSLQEGTGMSPIVLAMKVSKFQEINGVDEFPSIFDITGVEPKAIASFNNDLELAKIGSVEEYSQYSNSVKNPTSEGFKTFKVKTAKPFTGTYQKIFTFGDALNGNIDWRNLEGVPKETPTAYIEDNSIDTFNDLIFNGKSTTQSFSEVLDNVQKSLGDNYTSEIKDVVDKFKKLSKISNPIVTSGILSSEVGAQYDASTNTITLNTSNLKNSSTYLTLSTLLHEMAHSTTVGILNNPRNNSEQAFVNSIKEIFNKFRKVDDSYGFTSIEEFVAEVYSNPEFSKRLNNLIGENKQSLWSRFVDAVRRLFNMPVKNTKIIEDIITFVEAGQDGFYDLGVFNSKYHQERDLTDIDGKTKRLLDKMKDGVNTQLTSLKKAITKSKTVEELESYEEAIESLEVFQEALNTVEKDQIISIIALYAEEMAITMKSLRRRITERSNAYDKKTFDLKAIKALEELLVTYSLNDTIFAYANEAISRINPDTDAEYKEVVELLRKSSNQIESNKKEAEGLLHNRKKVLVKELLADKKFTAEVDSDFRDKFIKEYKMQQNTGFNTVDEYVAAQMFIHEDEIQAARVEFVDAMIENIGKDIDRFDKNLQDTLNVNNPFISMASAMITDFRSRLITAVRDSYAHLDKLHRAYKKAGNNATSIKEKYKKLLSVGENNKYYLQGEYTIELLNSQKEMFKRANQELFKENKAFTISDVENHQLNSLNQDFIFRESNEGVSENDVLNLRTGEDTTQRNYKVTNLKTYSKDNFDAVIDEVVAEFTMFDSYKQLKDSKMYATAKSPGSKLNPALYNFLQKKGDITAYKLNPYDAGVDYKSTNAYKNWVKDTFDVSETGSMTPKAKFKNQEFNNLSKAEKDVLTEFKNISKRARKTYNNGNDLIEIVGETPFYRLPSKHKGNLERRTSLDFKGMVKDYFADTFTIRQDDVEYSEPLDARGNRLRHQRVHNRGFVEFENQSLELFDLYAEEMENATRNEMRKNIDTNLNAMLDVVGGKEFYKKSQTISGYMLNSLNSNDPHITIKGSESNIFAKLAGIIESNIYDISMYYGGAIGKFDVNKLSSAVNGFAASTALTMNVASGIANVINGVSQLHIESAGGYFFNLKNLKQSELDYFKDMGNITTDINKPVKDSKTNAILQMFDFVGGRSLQQDKFIKDKLGNKLFSTDQMNVLNDLGEHYMSAVLSGAILNNIKVMNEDGEFINKNGDVVTSKEEAASMYDMIVKNPTTGVWEVDSKVVYTTHTHNLEMKDGGMAAISRLIKKKSHDMYGAYDTNLAPELQKIWWGKSLLMFKKFFLPGVQTRYKGVKNIFKSNEELRNDELTFNDALRVREEGYYVTTARFLIQASKNIKEYGVLFLSKQYKELSPYEQANIRKMFTELIITAVLVPALALLIGANWDDEDEDKPYAVLYQVNRLSQELTQFYNPISLYKMTSNPVAGLGIVNKSLVLMSNLLTPIKLQPDADESYFDWLNTNHEGENKLIRGFYSVTPFLAQFNKNWKDLNNQVVN